jgi:hypothetical protein
MPNTQPRHRRRQTLALELVNFTAIHNIIQYLYTEKGFDNHLTVIPILWHFADRGFEFLLPL